MRKIIQYLLLFFLLIHIVYVLTGVLFHPVENMDALGIWLLKAKAIYLEQGLPFSFLYDPQYLYSHPRYPLLLPFLFAGIYFFIGGISEISVLLLYPIMYVSILFLVYKTLLLKYSHFFSLLGTYIYSSFPILLGHGGRGLSGTADIFLVCIEWMIVYLLFRKMTGNKQYFAIVFLIMIASQVKLEGVFLSVILLFLPTSMLQKLKLFSLSLTPFFIWFFIVLFYQIPSDAQTTFILPGMSQFVERFMVISVSVVWEFLNINNWYIFWPIVFLLVFIKGKISKQLHNILLPSFFIILLITIGIYLFSSNETAGFVNSSFDRVLFQHSAIVFVLFCEKILVILKRYKANKLYTQLVLTESY